MRQRRGPRSTGARLVLLTLGVVVFYGSYYWGSLHAPERDGMRVLRLADPPISLAPFTLLDQFGNPFTEQRLTGHWNLVLFGYTRSAAASRETLFLATRVVNRLADSPALQRSTRALFVSLDPEYDTPETMKPFIDHYSPAFLAITGTPDQIGNLAGQLGVNYTIASGTAANPNIDHGTSIALIGPDGRLFGLFTGLVDEVSIASDLKQLAEMYGN